MSGPVDDALAAGYSQDEINSYLAPRMAEGRAAGYSQDEINSYLGITPPPPFDDGPARAKLSANLAHAAKPVTSFADALDAGWQLGTTALSVAPPSKTLAPEAPWYSRIGAGVAQMAGDLPAMGAGFLAGAVAGGPAAPFTGMAGAFALPAALRGTLMDAYEQGQFQNFGDFWDRMAPVFIDTAKNYITGAATAGAGAATTKLAGPAIAGALPASVSPTVNAAARTAAEVATMTTVGAGLEGRVPSAQEFVDAAIVLGGMHFVTAGAGKLREIYREKGIPPAAVVADAAHDPTIVQDLLSDKAVPEAYRGPSEADAAAAPPVAADPEASRRVAADVSAKLVAAGRPQEEADAAGEYAAAHYEARAAWFAGRRGSAEDIYRAEMDMRAEGEAPAEGEPTAEPGAPDNANSPPAEPDNATPEASPEAAGEQASPVLEPSPEQPGELAARHLAIADEWDALGNPGMAAAVRAGARMGSTPDGVAFLEKRLAEAKAKVDPTAPRAGETFDLGGFMATEGRDGGSLWRQYSESPEAQHYAPAVQQALQALVDRMNALGFTRASAHEQGGEGAVLKAQFSSLLGQFSRYVRDEVRVRAGSRIANPEQLDAMRTQLDAELAAAMRSEPSPSPESEPSPDTGAALEDYARRYEALGLPEKARAVRGMALYPGREIREDPAGEIARIGRDLAAREGRAAPSPESEPSPNAPAPNARAPNAPEGIESLDPSTIGVDAARFQFKAGGDERGVTDRLLGVKRWDQRLAGVVMVWRDENGRDWIADGHQRLGLAQRLQAEGQTGIRINAMVLDSRDGITDAEARATAAARNISEGSGTAIDAAKVIREASRSGITLPPLPPRSALVRDGSNLAKLGPDAFGMAINEVVPYSQAAIVGRIVADPAVQVEAMRVLGQLRPDNLGQTESIVRDLLSSGTELRTQDSLFGTEALASGIVLERAKIIDEATKQLATDRSTYRTLVNRADEIQSSGNQLATDTNLERLSTDEQATQLIKTLATTRGPVSDQLSGIAREFQAGHLTRADAGRRFLGVIRGSIEAGVDTRPTGGGVSDGAAAAEPEQLAPEAAPPPELVAQRLEQATRLRALAATDLQAVREDEARERQTNTPRRARMAAGAAMRSAEREQLATTMQNIADAIEHGEAPLLAKVANRASVEALDSAARQARYARERAENIPSRERESGAPLTDADMAYAKMPTDRGRLTRLGISNDSELQAALREYLPFRGRRREESPIKRMERALVGTKPGIDFFPTPKPLADRMVEAADIQPGMRVLEPSAGKGDLADAARAAGAHVDTVELSSTLQELLRAKGHTVAGADFMAFNPTEKYDRIIMNPPFSDRRDAAHVQRAYEMLKPGGRLVAITGEGVFFGSDAKASAFREWLQEHDAHAEKLPDGSFKSGFNPTGASTRLVTIDKPEAEGPELFQSRRLPKPPPAGAPLFGEAAPPPVAPRAPEPTVKTDERQIDMFGTGDAAVQAQAARDQQGRGGLTSKKPQEKPDEGLFAPKPDEGRTLFQRDPYDRSEDVPLYSAVQRAADGLRQARGTGEQMLSAIKKTAGVKPEEIKWLGLDDWLGGQKYVTKEQIQEYVAANQLEVREVVRSDEQTQEKRILDAGNAIKDALARTGHKLTLPDGTVLYHDEIARELQNRHTLPAELPEAHGLRAAAEAYMAAWNYEERPPTQYSSYKTEGGQGYQEILFTLPPKPRESELNNRAMIEKYGDLSSAYERMTPAESAEHDRVHMRDRLVDNLVQWIRQDPRLVDLMAHEPDGIDHARRFNEQMRATLNGHSHEQIYAAIEEARHPDARALTPFVGSHWQERNVVAHTRTSDFTAPDGSRVLVLHEVQSDWHQTGRREGYLEPVGTPQEIADQRTRISELGKETSRLYDEWTKARAVWFGMVPTREAAFHASLDDLDQAQRVANNRPARFTDEMRAADQARLAEFQQRHNAAFADVIDASANVQRTSLAHSEAAQRLSEAHARLATLTGDGPTRVPPAPFKTTWPMLVLKRMTKLAVDNGYDRLAWETGQTNAERYDLSRHIDAIHHERVLDDAGNPTDSYELWAYGRDGRQVFHEDEIPLSRVAEVVGGELAQKIERGEGEHIGGKMRDVRALTGLDLRAGGEGMKAFYDRMLPNEVQKMIGKFGGKVAESEIQTGPVKAPERDTIRPDAQATADHDAEWQRIVGQIHAMDEAATGHMPYHSAERQALFDRLNVIHERMVDETLRRMGAGPAPTATVHSFDITPQLREAVKSEGLPLFQKDDEQPPAAPKPPAQPAGQIRGKINLGDGRAVITLMRNAANASTVIHEFGHAWLEELLRDAAHPDAPAQLAEDAATVRAWMGADGASPISRDQHEQWARGFERYVLEGRAPSSGLARVFEQFRQWLVSIYQTAERLRAPISDEVRAVMSRMLAVDPEQTAIRPDDAPPGVAEAPEAQPAPPPPPPSAPPAGPPGPPGPPAAAAPPGAPDVGAAQAAILAHLSINEPGARRPWTWARLYTDTIDRLYPIWRASRELQAASAIEQLPANLDPGKLARLYVGAPGVARRALNDSTIDFTTREPNGPGLKQVLAPVAGNLDNFRAFIAAMRALELEDRGINTGFDLDAARLVTDAGRDRFGDTHQALIDYQDRLAAYARDAGVISRAGYDAMRGANRLYVPFQRVMDPAEEHPQRVSGGTMQAQNPLHAILGSERTVIDPLESVIRNTFLMTQMAERNNVGQSLVRLMASAHGSLTEVPTQISPAHALLTRLLEGFGIDPKTLASIADAVAPLADQQIRVLTDGRAQTYDVDPELARSFKGLDQDTANWLVRALAMPARTLRAGATLAPDFIARNLIRDFTTAVINTGKGVFSPIDSMRGLVGAIRQDADYQRWLSEGGASSAMVSLDRDYLQNNIRELTAETGLATRAWNVVRHPIDTLRLLSELSEQATRLGEFKGVYNKMTEGGASPAEAGREAAYSSREVTLDFARKGAQMRSVNMIVAFFNAQLQGVDRLGRAFKDQPVATSLKILAGVTLPSVALWWANHDDPRYNDLPNWEKDLFWIVMTDKWQDVAPQDAAGLNPALTRAGPNGSLQVNNGHIWRIPKPFETGVMFGSGVERSLDAYFNGKPGAFQDFTSSLFQALLPSFVPTVALPVAEQFANRSTFTGRVLVPDSMEKQLPEYEYTPYTTETAKRIGRVVGAFPGLRDLSLGDSATGSVAHALSSPILLENYLRAWSGNLGMYLLEAADAGLRQAGVVPDPVKPTDTLSDIPFIRAFTVRYPSASTQTITDFNDAWLLNSRYWASWEARAKEGDTAAMARIRAMATPPAQGAMTDINATMYQIGRSPIRTDPMVAPGVRQPAARAAIGPHGLVDLAGQQMQIVEQQLSAYQGPVTLEQMGTIHSVLLQQTQLVRDIYQNPTIPSGEKRQLIDTTYYRMQELARIGMMGVHRAESLAP